MFSVIFGTPHQSPCHLCLKVANKSSFCVFSGKSGGEIERNREKPSTARELERERSKRRKIAELVGGKDSGGEMERKIEIGSVQGSAPTYSVR